jgi:hypothetical protein
MRAKTLILLVASAGLMLGSTLTAPAQTGPSKSVTTSSASDQRSADWRARAMRAKAQAPDEAPARGRIADPEEAIRVVGDDSVGSGDLGKDRGDGGDGADAGDRGDGK